MKLTNSLLILFGLMLSMPAPSQVLTALVGAPPPAPTILVNTNDTWSYRKGLSEPQADWRTVADGGLDTTWLTGPGGFGFGDGDDATVLDDMLNAYTTVYIRKSFEIPAGTDPSRRVILTMDWDDGFVAYLDGVEVSRSPNVAVAEPLFDSITVAGQNHESHGGGGAVPASFDLGSVAALSPAGTHVLSVVGLNAGASSSDFSLIASLRLDGGASVAGGGAFFAIVTETNTALSGANTVAGSVRVTINGDDAAFDSLAGTWSATRALKPGMNRLFIAAHDPEGNILASTNRDVVVETATQFIGGDITNAVTVDGAAGVLRLTNSIRVMDGGHLAIQPPCVVLLGPGQSIRADSGGRVTALGAFFVPADGAGSWDQLSANGANATMELTGAELVAGQLRVTAGAEMRLAACTVRELHARQILEASDGGFLEIRNCHFLNYAQSHIDFTPTRVEGSLFENITSDAMDFLGQPADIDVLTSTWRNGTGANTDAIDLGMNLGVTIAGNIIHHFPDKGISVAENAHANAVVNNLIHHCGTGLNVYASSNNVFFNNTISACSNGMRLYERTAGQGAGFAVASNMIIWDNSNNVRIEDGSQLDLSFSVVQGGFPGEGNISGDPLFADGAAGDFSLLEGSPAIQAGRGGVNMGAEVHRDAVPGIGGIPSAPSALTASSERDTITLRWRDTADNTRDFQIERSADGDGWEALMVVPAPGTTAVLTNDAANASYYFRVTAVSGAGPSLRSSNPARVAAGGDKLLVGGVMRADTVWSPALGTITVVSNLIVPSGVTLTMMPGTVVQLTNLVSIIAAGGTIDIAGTAENKVLLQPLVGTNIWGQLSGQFGANLTVRHAEIASGQLTVYSNAVGLIEDVYIHDYRRAGGSLFTAPIILTHFAAPTTVRRTIVREYHETLWRNGVLTIEECLFENISGDAVDFDSAQPGTVIRNCTFRHGNRGNVDALDVGPGDIPGSFDVRIENCMMFDFPFDKGVSVGDNNSSRGTIVSNCFIYACLSGVMAKDRTDVSVRHSTIVDNAWGLTNYNKVNPSSSTGGGITTNTYNNIIVGNTITISMANGGQLFADHNIFSNTNWPGEGNIDIDPLFVNPAGRDYRLAENSPARSAGRDGAEMGARFPVGAAMVLSHPRIEEIDGTGANAVVRFWADNEKTYSLLSSPVVEGGAWTKVADVGTADLPRFLSVTNTVAPGNRFYKLVTPAVP